MKLLYYDWNENSKLDCVECMRSLGYDVTEFAHKMTDLTTDDRFKEALHNVLMSGYDLVFSFNYFPLISEVCQDIGTPYISWVYDSPHLTLYSYTIDNPCNHVYAFDYALIERLKPTGITNIDYMPLACNISRLNKLCAPHILRPVHDISFIGSLYNDSNTFYDQITYLPEFLKGYLDAVIASQEMVYGMDLTQILMDERICDEMSKYVHAELGPAYRPAQDQILRDMLLKKVTQNERLHLLKLLGNNFSVDLYAPAPPPKDIKVNYKGYVDYYCKMPIVFASSRININITLRSILSGIPLRVIDILGAGGFVLTNYQQELTEYFEYGQDIIWFESADDLVDKANYYLRHEDERIRIAKAGHETACSEFSYEKILPMLFSDM